MASRKLKPGDTVISAAEWNRHVDAADAYFRKGELGNSSSTGRGNDTNCCKVKNSSGANRRAGDILEFTGLALTNLEGDVPVLWFTGGSPTLANSFGVLLRPTPTDEIDLCQVAGICRAYVNVTDANHKFATVDNAEFVLQSAASGPVRILYKPSGTGEKMCGVLITGDSTMVVKPDADIAKGSSGTCSIYINGSDSGADLTLTALGAAVVEGKYALAWGGYVFPWECEEEE